MEEGEVVKQYYDDIIGCIVQSLNDGFMDYCFNDNQLSMVVNRLRKEGKTSMLYNKVEDFTGSYYQLLPIKLYKRFNGEDMCITRMSMKADKIPDRFKCMFERKNSTVLIKDYDNTVDYYNLERVIQLTDEENIEEGKVETFENPKYHKKKKSKAV